MARDVIDQETIKQARLRKCYLDDGSAPATSKDAALLVNQRGFLLLGVDKKRGLPNLSETDPDREWDVSWRAWEWKESLPGSRSCAYLKWFFNQGTFISWDLYPYFYSLWGLKSDPSEAYLSGLLSMQELDVLTIISEAGPISSRDLWKRLRVKFGGKRSTMLNSLLRLQRLFCVAVSGGETTGWSMHTWDLVSRSVPSGLLHGVPPQKESMENLILNTCEAVPYCTPREVGAMFRWQPSFVLEVAQDLESRGLCSLSRRVAGNRESCIMPGD